KWLTSGGLGAMGFGLPAVIGAAVARPDAVVVDIDDDGSFIMNVQELATIGVEIFELRYCYSGVVELRVEVLRRPHQVFGAATWGIVRNTIELPVGNNVVPLRSDTIRLVQNGCSFHGLRPLAPSPNFYDPVNPVTRRIIDQSTGNKLCDLNVEESWALLEDLSLYDNESWNDPRDSAKPVKAITLPQDVLSTSDRRLIKLENQVQRLMEAHLAPTQPTQVNKIDTSCEICSGPHDTQYYMKNPEQAFVDYASSRIHEAGGKWYTFKPEQNNVGETYNPSWRSHPNIRWRQPQNS
nr:acetolactate synthase [Tanacetum cinerariifolium]